MTSLRKRRVVIDTNVFVSGVVFGGIPGEVLKQVKRPEITLLMSHLLAKEILAQLVLFHVPNFTYRMVAYEVQTRARMLSPRITPRKSRDPKDDMLLALCLAGHADYLVTGDKDLLVLRQFDTAKIVTPRQFLEENVH
jgi:uncharacterized protein